MEVLKLNLLLIQIYLVFFRLIDKQKNQPSEINSFNELFLRLQAIDFVCYRVFLVWDFCGEPQTTTFGIKLSPH